MYVAVLCLRMMSLYDAQQTLLDMAMLKAQLY